MINMTKEEIKEGYIGLKERSLTVYTLPDKRELLSDLDKLIAFLDDELNKDELFLMESKLGRFNYLVGKSEEIAAKLN